MYCFFIHIFYICVFNAGKSVIKIVHTDLYRCFSRGSPALHRLAYIFCKYGAIRCLVIDTSLDVLLFSVCRDCESNDSCDQPGNVHVLGDVSVVCHGNHGQ